MVDIQRILCPIDFSEASGHALEHAVASARSYGGQITVLHVYRELPVADGVAVLPPIEPEDVAEKVRAFCAPVMTGRPPEIVVTEGRPAKEIVRLAEHMPADLLVMGTHGRGGFERLFLGSVTEKVLRTTRCPVLTVPPPARTPAASPVLYKTILCPLDFSDASSRALEYAVSLAKEAGGRLILLHVVEGITDQPREMAHFTVPEYGRYLEEDATARLKAAIPGEARTAFTSEERVAVGKAYREILRIAADTGAELIVMGVHGRGAVDHWLFGATANHIIREATCPVLTLRPTSTPGAAV